MPGTATRPGRHSSLTPVGAGACEKCVQSLTQYGQPYKSHDWVGFHTPQLHLTLFSWPPRHASSRAQEQGTALSPRQGSSPGFEPQRESISRTAWLQPTYLPSGNVPCPLFMPKRSGILILVATRRTLVEVLPPLGGLGAPLAATRHPASGDGRWRTQYASHVSPPWRPGISSPHLGRVERSSISDYELCLE